MRILLRSLPIVALVIGGPMIGACQRASNAPDYETRVQDRLKDANLKDVNANWKKDENTLHLTGEVKAEADKRRAEEVASEVVGTSGRVVNEVKVEGVDYNELDSRIERQLDQMFKEDDQWDRDNFDLTFRSKAGVVTITGSAPSQAAKDRVTERVRPVEGVKDVLNDLEVKPEKAKKHTK